MKIDKVKLDDGICIDYSMYSESFRIDTGEDPKSSLYAAAGKLVLTALRLFGLQLNAGLFKVECSYGDEPGSKLILLIHTNTGDKAKVQLPKVESEELIDYTTGLPQQHPQNDYNKALEEFLAEVSQFLEGKRLQMALSFDSVPAEDEDDGEKEGPVAADRVVNFKTV